MIMVVYVVHKLRSFRSAFVIALMGVLWWQFLILVPAQRSGDQAFLEFRYVYEYPTQFLLLFMTILFVLFYVDVWKKRLWWRYGAFFFVLAVSFFFFQQSTMIRDQIRADSWQYKYKFPLMKAYEWLDEHVPHDAVIANSLNPLYYPLYGPKLKRTVRYVNINDCGDCDYYSYQQKGLTVRDNPDVEAWKENLEDLGVDYVVLGYSIKEGLEGVYPYELDWVEEYSDEFELLFEDNGVRIYGM